MRGGVFVVVCLIGKNKIILIKHKLIATLFVPFSFFLFGRVLGSRNPIESSQRRIDYTATLPAPLSSSTREG